MPANRWYCPTFQYEYEPFVHWVEISNVVG
jgi:hypothetical protein